MFEEIRYIQKSLEQKQLDFTVANDDLIESKKRFKMIDQSYK